MATATAAAAAGDPSSRTAPHPNSGSRSSAAPRALVARPAVRPKGVGAWRCRFRTCLRGRAAACSSSSSSGGGGSRQQQQTGELQLESAADAGAFSGRQPLKREPAENETPGNGANDRNELHAPP